MGDGFLGECGPLRIAHDAASAGGVIGYFDAGEFATGNQRRFGSIGVSSFRGHQIGEVQAACFHFHEHLFGRGMRVGDLLQFENVGTAETRDDQSFHGGEFSRIEVRGEVLRQIADGRGRLSLHSDRQSLCSSLEVWLTASIMMFEFSDLPLPEGLFGGGGEDWAGFSARSEGAEGNVRASRVWKGNARWITPACVFRARTDFRISIGP